MLNTVTFQIGTDVIGQPLYHTHFISENEDKISVNISVTNITHR